MKDKGCKLTIAGCLFATALFAVCFSAISKYSYRRSVALTKGSIDWTSRYVLSNTNALDRVVAAKPQGKFVEVESVAGTESQHPYFEKNVRDGWGRILEIAIARKNEQLKLIIRSKGQDPLSDRDDIVRTYRVDQ